MPVTAASPDGFGAEFVRHVRSQHPELAVFPDVGDDRLDALGDLLVRIGIPLAKPLKLRPAQLGHALQRPIHAACGGWRQQTRAKAAGPNAPRVAHLAQLRQQKLAGQLQHLATPCRFVVRARAGPVAEPSLVTGKVRNLPSVGRWSLK